MEEKNSFVFFRSFYEAFNEIDDKDIKVEFIEAICKYCLDGEEYTFKSNVSKALFIAIKPTMNSANARYKASVENGKKGGRPKKNKNLEKPSNNLEKPNHNLDVDVDDDVDVDINNTIIVENNNLSNVVKEVIDYMNDLAGTNYKATTVKTKKLINARLKEGATVEELKDVVYYKYKEWYEKPFKFQNGVSSDVYFRPNTLFSNNFEGYLESYNREYVDVEGE